MKLYLDPTSIESYRQFLAIKQLPSFRIRGRVAEFPDEYIDRLGLRAAAASPIVNYAPLPGLFDYQVDISRLMIRKRKFAAFVDPGLGKTLMMLECARHALASLPSDKCVLIIAPLMVIPQHLEEIYRFYGDDLPIKQVSAANLPEWLANGKERFGITNYDGLKENIRQGRLGALLLDESSTLSNYYGKWAQKCVELGKGLEFKYCFTGTPAPNDRIEYGNHAVFLDQFPNINAFLARYFVNRGQTQNRWELKPHALEPFYRSLSHWCIFLSNPATYGWKDNCGTIPPINVHIENVDLTPEQEAIVRKETGGLFAYKIGGIVSRGKLARIAKGFHEGREIATNKPEWIKRKVESWPGESTIIWCNYNDEQAALARLFPNAANISGSTPHWRRLELIDDFRRGRRTELISKASILGMGLNLEIATRQIFSSLHDSYLDFWQAVKRSNRIGSTQPLNVHVPTTDVEIPMIETVLAKAKRIQQDTEVQERLFQKTSGYKA